MGENNEDFRDELKKFAEISDLIESSKIFENEKVDLKVTLKKEKYESLLKNFREIDWSSDKFFINFGKVSFKFILEK
jgi:ribosomal protein L5